MKAITGEIMRLILIEHKPSGQDFAESEHVVMAVSQCGLGAKRLHLPPNISLTELECILKDNSF